MAVTFDPPLPGPNLPILQPTVVTGTVDGDDAVCSVDGVTVQHHVLSAFALGIDGAFRVTIAAGLLMDNNLYRLKIWSNNTGSSGQIDLDTRPAG
jgi:hypothetical protein